MITKSFCKSDILLQLRSSIKYLEISSRRTGKTTRLLKRIKKSVKRCKKVGVMTFNSQQTENFKIDGVKTFSNSKGMIGSTFDDLFFDEFDFIDENELMKVLSLVIDWKKKGHKTKLFFVTTPRKLRTNEEFYSCSDIFSQILMTNKMGYIKYLSLPDEMSKDWFNTMEELRGKMEPSVISRELDGNFMT